MDFIKEILNYMTDSSNAISARTAVLILTIASLFFIDNYIGFSYYYNNQKKLSQLELIIKLKNNTNLNYTTKEKLIAYENSILQRENLIERSARFVRSVLSSQSTNSPSPSHLKKRNNLLFLCSSSWLYLLSALIFPFFIFLSDKTSPIYIKVSAITILLVITFILSWFNYWLFGMIISKEICGSWYWNYFLNAFLHPLSLFLLASLMNLNKKQ